MNRKQRKAVAKTQTKTGMLQPAEAFTQALAHHQAGHPDAAEPLYRYVLQHAPTHAASHGNLAVILRQRGHLTEALEHYQEANRHKPDDANTLYNMGIALRELGRYDEAIQCYQKAITLDPRQINARTNLGDVLKTQNRIAEAVAVLREAVELAPQHTQALYNLGVCLKDQGQTDDALAILQRAWAADPQFFTARLSICMTRLPIIYHSEAEIEQRRTAYQSDLEDLVRSTRLDTPEAVIAGSDAVGLIQPFFLTYQGRCDRDLQRLYGGLTHRLMSARYPAFAQRPPMPPRQPGEPLRIGILSGYFRHHSNWKIPIRGWLENLDRQRFSLYGYHTDRTRDDLTPVAEQLCTRFVQGPLSIEAWANTIRADNLHVLIVPEVGMDPTTVKLASLWLAPVQMNSWGHPETSGLPTLDYYLSSDLMEPADADAHYSEKLVRLPNMSVHYTPVPPPHHALTRADLGVQPDATMFWCCQSLFKYLPQYDRVFPRIARRVPGAQFVFIRYGKGAAVNEVFEARLRAAFAAEAVPYEGSCLFVPPLDYARFNAATALADVFLDSIGWSGCNTTLEALAHNVPVVTLPGTLMRGRHSYAILKMIGLESCIAHDEADYIERAVRMATDRAWRAEISAYIAANKSRAYGDMSCVRALEQVLEQVVDAAQPG